MALGDHFTRFSQNLKLLKVLVKALPKSVPVASQSDRIFEVFSNIPVPSNPAEQFEVFNRRMDNLFGEDLRDAQGRLLNVKRGVKGMDMVVKYFIEAADAGNLVWDLALVKIERLVKELEILIDAADKDYAPPKDGNSPDSSDVEVSGQILDGNGNELLENTDQGNELEGKHKAKKAQLAEASTGKGKGRKDKKDKKAKKSAAANRAGTSSQPFILESDGDDSDGLSAMKKVEAASAAQQAQRGPANASMQHFHEPQPVVARNGEKRWEFKCKHCGSIRTFERKVDGPNITIDSESVLPKLNNLATHVSECTKKNPPPTVEDEDDPVTEKLNLKKSADLMRAYLKDGELNPAVNPTQTGFYRLFAAWILDESLPWTTGEAPSLKLLFQSLKVKFTLPTDTTVHNQLGRIFAELHGKVMHDFTNVKSKIAYATNTWTTKQMVYTFACTVASFIDDEWDLIERVVDFKPLEDKEHEGYLGGMAFINGTRQRGGLDKMSAIYLSLKLFHLPLNDVIIETAARCLLARYGIAYTPDMQVRCIAHVLNLVVQAFLYGMDEALNPDDIDYYEDHKDGPIHYDIDKDEEQLAMENEDLSQDEMANPDMERVPLSVDEEREMVNSMGGESAIKHLRFICTKIVSSPQRRGQFRKLAEEKFGGPDKSEESQRLARLMVVRDVRTRWNYTHAMIRHGLLLKDPLDTWVFNNPSLRGLTLTDGDWETLQQVADFLEIFTDATAQMSQASQPTIPWVLPLYVKMERHLRATINNRTSIHIRIRQGAETVLVKLLKYKKFTDTNQFYTLGTVLHPSLRAGWFKQTAPSNDLIAQQAAVAKAETLFRHVALTYFENQTAVVPESSSTSTAAGPQPSAKPGWMADILDFTTDDVPTEMKTPREEFDDEVNRYLKYEGGKGNPEEPLAWWKIHSPAFPMIARMARDFLAIPATSVSVERTFSKSRHICSDLRSSLKAETIALALLVKVWIRSGLFDVNEPLKHKRKHRKN